MAPATQLTGDVKGLGRTLRPLRGSLAAVAVGALLLAGCGSDDGDGIEVEEGVGSAASTEEGDPVSSTAEPAGDEVDSATDAEDDATTGDDDAASDATTGVSEIPEHAPPAPLACAGIDDTSPGAIILFPDAGNSASLEAGPGPVTVVVEGCSDTFEANLEYEAYHGQNSNPTLSGFTSGGTLGNWEAFSISETYWTPGEWTVVVFELDAESGDRVEYDEITFTVD